jgi:protein TonB
MTAATMTVRRTPFDDFRTPLFVSVGIHAIAIAFVAVTGIVGYFGSGNSGSGGAAGSVKVGLVGNAPAIPLPENQEQTPSRVVDESKGLYQSPPKATPRPEPDATPIPKFEKNKQPKPTAKPPDTLTEPPKYKSNPSKILESPEPPPPNAVPYGGGGAPAIPRGAATFSMGNTATQGQLAFNGGADGDFGSRFGYYVDALQRKVSGSWLQSTIDPSVPWAPRVIVQFDVERDGSIRNVQVVQSSSNYSVDTSVVRAVQSASPLQPLPPAYSGSYVNVQFYFDYKKQ